MNVLALWLVLAAPAAPSGGLLPSVEATPNAEAARPAETKAPNAGAAGAKASGGSPRAATNTPNMASPDAPPLGGVVQHPARRPERPEPLSTRALPLATPEELEGFAEDEALAAPRPHPIEDAAPPAARPGDAPGTIATEPPVEPAVEPTVVLRTATPEPDPPKRLTFKRRPHPPERSAAFLFGYRTFAIRDALRRHQSWHVVSLEVSPLRRYVRLNLITEFGWEGGEAARGKDRADLMLVGKGGLGVQYPHWVTPFVEFQGGAGLARVELFERNELVFLYTLGVEAGAQWAVARWLYLHAAVGWIRPVMRHPDRTVRFDRATFKVGFGF